MEVGLSSFPLPFENFFVQLLLAKCRHIFYFDKHNISAPQLYGDEISFLFVPVSNEEVFSTKLILLS